MLFDEDPPYFMFLDMRPLSIVRFASPLLDYSSQKQFYFFFIFYLPGSVSCIKLHNYETLESEYNRSIRFPFENNYLKKWSKIVA